MVKRVKIKNSGIIKLQRYNDYPDGNLIIAEANRIIPFKIKRVYYINKLDNPRATRGKHAHKNLEQVIFCINGSFALHLDDGETKQKIIMNNSSVGIKLGRLLWHTMTDFSKNCVILVLASDYYKENDYIRNYDEFLKYINRIKKKQK